MSQLPSTPNPFGNRQRAIPGIQPLPLPGRQAAGQIGASSFPASQAGGGPAIAGAAIGRGIENAADSFATAIEKNKLKKEKIEQDNLTQAAAGLDRKFSRVMNVINRVQSDASAVETQFAMDPVGLRRPEMRASYDRLRSGQEGLRHLGMEAEGIYDDVMLDLSELDNPSAELERVQQAAGEMTRFLDNIHGHNPGRGAERNPDGTISPSLVDSAMTLVATVGAITDAQEQLLQQGVRTQDLIQATDDSVQVSILRTKQGIQQTYNMLGDPSGSSPEAVVENTNVLVQNLLNRIMNDKLTGDETAPELLGLMYQDSDHLQGLRPYIDSAVASMKGTLEKGPESTAGDIELFGLSAAMNPITRALAIARNGALGGDPGAERGEFFFRQKDDPDQGITLDLGRSLAGVAQRMVTEDPESLRIFLKANAKLDAFTRAMAQTNSVKSMSDKFQFNSAYKDIRSEMVRAVGEGRTPDMQAISQTVLQQHPYAGETIRFVREQFLRNDEEGNRLELMHPFDGVGPGPTVQENRPKPPSPEQKALLGPPAPAGATP